MCSLEILLSVLPVAGRVPQVATSPPCRREGDELTSLHVPSARDHALCNGYSLALCDRAASATKNQVNVRYGSKADICAAKACPDSRKRSCPHYPPRADVCGANRPVCFGPIADISECKECCRSQTLKLFDDLIDDGQHACRDCQLQRLCRFAIEYK
jgi:hypothetical protein